MNNEVFIIAEAGVNHNGDLEIAKALIDVASESGADAVKFQSFLADDLSTDYADQAIYQARNTGKKESQKEMLKRIELKRDDHQTLIDYCELKNIEFMSSPFDIGSAKFLSKIGIKRFKIPSGEITNKPFLQEIAKHNIPTILSTGMANMLEVENAVKILKDAGLDHENISVLQCTTDYPAKMTEANLLSIKKFHDDLELRVGYSDHTIGDFCAVVAVSIGASIIEKHFTLDKEMDGPDHKASLEPSELKAYIKKIREVKSVLGEYKKEPSASEIKNKDIVRKSIVARKKILKGEMIEESKLAFKRPGNGISPMDFENVVGTLAIKDFEADEQIILKNE